MLDFNEDSNEISCVQVYNHPEEIWSLDPSPRDATLFFTCYNSGSTHGASLWRAPALAAGGSGSGGNGGGGGGGDEDAKDGDGGGAGPASNLEKVGRRERGGTGVLDTERKGQNGLLRAYSALPRLWTTASVPAPATAFI